MRKEVTLGPDFIDYFSECDMDLNEPYTFGPLMLQLRKDTIMWNSKIEYLIKKYSIKTIQIHIARSS